MQNKISIIIPIYNSEKYLRQCVDSVLSQTYENLEIILVNDGSDDNSGFICDEYAALDSRINVIHQENKGVAAARNAGLAMATGDYIGWVDSDDWVELNMYEYMLDKAILHNADIVVCSRFEQYSDESILRGWRQDEILDKQQALQILLEDAVMKNYLCDKLFRRELFADVIFPCGAIYEDVAVMYKLFGCAAKVVCLSEAMYNYRQHGAGITDDDSVGGKIAFFMVLKNRYIDMADRWPDFRILLLKPCMVVAKDIWSGCSKEERKRFGKQLVEIADFCSKHYREVWPCLAWGIAGRSILRLTSCAKWWAFALAGFVSWLYKLKRGQNL